MDLTSDCEEEDREYLAQVIKRQQLKDLYLVKLPEYNAYQVGTGIDDQYHLWLVLTSRDSREYSATGLGLQRAFNVVAILELVFGSGPPALIGHYLGSAVESIDRKEYGLVRRDALGWWNAEMAKTREQIIQEEKARLELDSGPIDLTDDEQFWEEIQGVDRITKIRLSEIAFQRGEQERFKRTGGFRDNIYGWG